MISNGEMIDFSINKTFEKMNIYTIASSSSMECDFKLSSRTKILEDDKEINLKFIQRDNANNNIYAKSTLSSIDSQISGSFNQNVNNYYYLDSFIGLSEHGFFYIEPEDSKNYFKIHCQTKKKSNLAKILIPIFAVLLVIVVVIIIIVCIRKRRNSFEYNPKIRNEKKLQGDSSMEGLDISWNARRNF